MMFFCKPKHTNESLEKLVDNMLNSGMKKILIQEKLDGLRCFATVNVNDVVKLTSRQDKAINLPHIHDELITLVQYLQANDSKLSSIIFDGEIYNKNMHLNLITGFLNIKNKQCNSIDCFFKF